MKKILKYFKKNPYKDLEKHTKMLYKKGLL